MHHIIYIPGLGDRYDGIRKLGLRRWNTKDTRVSHIPMHWLDRHETFQEKLQRIKRLIDTYPDERVTLVGESAGGAMAIVAMRIFEDTIENVVTLCGMNYGAGSVSPYLYKSNPAFQDVMIKADTILPTMTDAEKNQMFILYSSKDFTVRPSSSLIAGVMSHDLKIAGHMVAILTVLFFRFRLILDRK